MTRISNPVLSGFHPDPSILRAGDTYYIATSTFEWYPGVEIHRSKDMAHWEKLPSPLSEKRLLDMAGANASAGIWAPCLSWHDGLFWLIYTNMRSFSINPWKDQPNYLTYAPSIEGPWADPVFLNGTGFDPSLFHDDDGRKWLLNMETDFRKPRQPRGLQFSGILMQEYDHAQKKLIGPVKKISTGTALSLSEGPHLYKRNGWYFLLLAEGGTGIGHAASVARSRSIDGPYELHPHNPLITSYGHPELRLQRAGHGSWCDSPDGRTYMAFLCGRFLPGTDLCMLGRETSIVEIEWRDDWPYVIPEPNVPKITDGHIWNFPTDTFSPPVNVPQPVTEESRTYKFAEGIHDDFKNLRIERDPEFYSTSARPGFLRLKGGESPVSLFRQTLLARRQQHFSFSAETKMEFSPKAFQEFAGLCWRYDEVRQYLLSVSWNEEKAMRSLRVISMNPSDQYSFSYETFLPPEGPVWLGIRVREKEGMFRYSLDGKIWSEVRPVLESATFCTGGFTGPFVGIFCCDLAQYKAVADFEYFTYAPIKN